MFDFSFVGAGTASRRPWTFTVSLLFQGFLIAILALTSIVAGPGLPLHDWTAVFLEPPPPPPPAAPPPQPQPVRAAAPERFQSELLQPTRIPDRVAMIRGRRRRRRRASVFGATGPAGPGGGVIPGFLGSTACEVPPPPPPPPVEAAPQPDVPSSIVVGGAVQAARIIHKVAPAYPPLARQARIEGVVKLEAVIAEDGAIDQLQTLSGHPLLVPAALQAVRQWRYRPTLLNNRPVRVVTQVEVRFQLH